MQTTAFTTGARCGVARRVGATRTASVKRAAPIVRAAAQTEELVDEVSDHAAAVMADIESPRNRRSSHLDSCKLQNDASACLTASFALYICAAAWLQAHAQGCQGGCC